jgi:hypothetical protein
LTNKKEHEGLGDCSCSISERWWGEMVWRNGGRNGGEVQVEDIVTEVVHDMDFEWVNP